ncbi:hypothetical protein G6F22_021659 [Rhizopus arrhizus]|nr:hypothetical protein G6F22_021659 [Rhizopus arrhizus]
MLAEVEFDDLRDVHPAEGGDIGDGKLVAGQPRALRQARVEDGKGVFTQAAKALDGRVMALGRKAFGMHALAQKRAHAGAMEHQPGNGFPSPLGIGSAPD